MLDMFYEIAITFVMSGSAFAYLNPSSGISNYVMATK